VLGLHSVDALAGDYNGSAGLAGLAAIVAERLGSSPHIASASGPSPV
jgi:hypothetical protein